MEITERIAEYVTTTTLEDFPSEAIEAAKGALMDCLGCALAGSVELLAAILSDFVRSTGGGPSASVIGRGFKTSAPEAVLVNGAMAHALDYDDINRIVKGHPSAVLAPAALALGEEAGASGRDMLLGYMLGFEVACAVGDSTSVNFHDDLGWHPTSPLGTLGSAAVASRMLSLDREQTAMAISLAASQAAGLRQNFGTMTKPYHAGAAGRHGVTAAKLVQAGFTASNDAIEGRFGFLHAFSGGSGYNLEKLLQNLGHRCYFTETGIEIKKYPCCGSAHLALNAAARLLERETIEPSKIDRIAVMVDFDPPRSLIHDRPKQGLEGKFSMNYCMAAAFLDRKIGLGTFTDDQVMRPEAQSLIPKVEMVRIAGYEGRPSWVEAYNVVEVHMQDGRVLQERTDRPAEGALRGTTLDDIRNKFRDCASLALTPAATDEVIGLLDNLEDVEDSGTLAALLRGDG